MRFLEQKFKVNSRLTINNFFLFFSLSARMIEEQVYKCDGVRLCVRFICILPNLDMI